MRNVIPPFGAGLAESAEPFFIKAKWQHPEDFEEPMFE